jgi:hypothetical protein
MTDKVILGVHSNVSAQGSSGLDGYTDGHAWLSIRVGGQYQTYGLWPDEHPVIKAMGWDNGSGSDIRTGMEQKAPTDASRYYELTPQQYQEFQKELQDNVTGVTPIRAHHGRAKSQLKLQVKPLTPMTSLVSKHPVKWGKVSTNLKKNSQHLLMLLLKYKAIVCRA